MMMSVPTSTTVSCNSVTRSLLGAINYNVASPRTDFDFNVTRSIRQSPENKWLLVDNSELSNIQNYCFDSWREVPKFDAITAINYAYAYAQAVDNVNGLEKQDEYLLHLEVIIKFLSIEQAVSIYCDQEKDVTTFNIMLNIATYDFELMDKIYSKIEYPIRNTYEKEKLISFKYFYNFAEQETNNTTYGQLIYKK